MELFRHGEDETAAMLLMVSQKAQEKGEAYAAQTAPPPRRSRVKLVSCG
jgi:hypothetical protein